MGMWKFATWHHMSGTESINSQMWILKYSTCQQRKRICS